MTRIPQTGEDVVRRACKRALRERTLSYRTELIPEEVAERVLLDLRTGGYAITKLDPEQPDPSAPGDPYEDD